MGDFLRDKTGYVISTKVGKMLRAVPQDQVPDHDFVDPLPFAFDFDCSCDAILQSCEFSLARLGLNKLPPTEKIFYVAQRQPEPDVHHHVKADNLLAGLEVAKGGSVWTSGETVPAPCPSQPAFFGQSLVAQSCILINHKRFARSALHVLSDLTEFGTVITDAAPAPEDQAAMDRSGIKLTIAWDTK